MKLVGARFKTDKKQDLWRCFSKRYCVCNTCLQAGGQLGSIWRQIHLGSDPLSPEFMPQSFPKDCNMDNV